MKRARGNVIEGEDRVLNARYAWLTVFRFGDHDAVVRSLCGRAAAKMETDAFLGLQPLLTTLHAERLCARRRMIFHAIFGDDAYESAELCLHPNQAARRTAVIASARDSLFPRTLPDLINGRESARLPNSQ